MRRVLLSLALALCSLPAFGAIAIGAPGSFGTCNAATTCDVDTPSHSDGDLLMAMCGASDDDNAANINETGWPTTAPNEAFIDNDNGSDGGLILAFKVASSEPDPMQCETFGSAVSIRTRMWALTGVHADLFDQTAVDGTETVDATSHDPPAIVTPSDNSWVISAITCSGSTQSGTSPPSGYTTIIDLDDAAQSGNTRHGLAYILKATAGSEDPGAWTGLNAASDCQSKTLAIKASTASPAGFDSAPTVTSQTHAAYTIGYDADANAANIFVGLYPKDATAPTCDEIEAGTGDRATATEATTGSADSIVITAPEDPQWYIGDIYACVEGAGGDSAVTTLADEVLDIPSGMQRITLTSIDATSPYFGTTVEVGDTCTIPLVTSPSAYVVTDEADGTISYAASGDTSRQILDPVYCYDVDSPANLEFVLVFNNGAPQLAEGVDTLFEAVLYELGADPGIDLSLLMVDPELDDIDWTVESGAMPDDWSLNAETGVISDGDPGACGAFTFTIGATDAYGELTEVPSTATIGPLVPAFTGDDEATYVAEVEALCSLTATAGAPQYSASVAIGDVVAVTPAVGTLVQPDDEVTYSLSLGDPPPGGGQFNYFRLNLGIGQ